MLTFRYSDTGLALTKRYEGLRLKAYQDQGGVWTIGYGHTGSDVDIGREVTALEAEALLRVDLRDALDCVNRSVKVQLEQHHFDALVDFCYNAGRGNFLSSSLLRKLNNKDLTGAAEEFARWINVNGSPNRGLQRRRAAEAAMFQGSYRPNSLA